MKRLAYKLFACCLWLSASLLPIVAVADKYPKKSIEYYLSADVAMRQLDLAAAVEFCDRLTRDDLMYINKPNRRFIVKKVADIYLLAGRYQKVTRLAEYNDASALPYLLQTLKAVREEKWRTAEKKLQRVGDNENNRLWHYWVVPFLQLWTLTGQQQEEAAFEKLAELRSIEAFGNILSLQEIRMHLHLRQPQAVLDKLSAARNLPPLFLAHYLQALALAEGRSAALEMLRTRAPAVEAYAPHNALLQEVKQALENDIAIEATLIPPARAIGDLFVYIAELLQEELPHEALMYARLADYAVIDNHAAVDVIADILAEHGQYDAAINILQASAAKADLPLRFAHQARISDYLLQSGQAREAERRLLDLRRQYPEDTQMREALAAFYRQTEAHSKAITLYDEEIALLNEPQAQNWRVFYLRGIAYEQLRDWPQAERDLLQALRLAPNNPYVMNYLGYSWVDRGENLQHGFRLLQKAESLRSNDGAIADSLGWAYYRLGDFDSAVIYLEKAVGLSPESSIIIDHLGDAYWRVGRRIEARFQWKRALRMHDMTEGLREVVERKLEQAEDGEVILSRLNFGG